MKKNVHLLYPIVHQLQFTAEPPRPIVVEPLHQPLEEVPQMTIQDILKQQ